MTKHPSLPCSTPPALPADRNNLDRLAALTRVRLTPEEKAALEIHLHTMLSYIEKLTQVNTDGIEPMANAVETSTVMREDRVTNQPNTEALLNNASVRMGDCFVVPRMVE